MNQKINIAIAEDHRLVRQGFVRMLNDYNNINILFEANNGKELLKHLKEFKPDIVLLDIAMPLLGGIGAMEKMKERYPKIKIIVISSYSEDLSIVEYVKLGANSFLNKHCEVESLVTAIHALNENDNYFDDSTTKLLNKYGALPGQTNKRELTEREIIVLRHLHGNKPHSEIAELMGLKEKTIDWYKHILLQKTNCKDTKELIVFAGKNNHI